MGLARWIGWRREPATAALPLMASTTTSGDARGGPQMEPIQLAAILVGAALLASMVSVEVGISVALVELALGVALGNVFNLDTNAGWLVFVAGFASVVLTFLAGAEVDPDDFRERLGASITIGVASFAGPFIVATLHA